MFGSIGLPQLIFIFLAVLIAWAVYGHAAHFPADSRRPRIRS